MAGENDENYQTVHDSQGQTHAEGPSSVQEGEDWSQYAFAEHEEEGFEEQERVGEQAQEREAAEPTSETDGQEGESTEESESQSAEAAEEEQAQQEEQPQEEEQESQQEEESRELTEEEYRQRRQQVVENLSQNYQLSDEQADQLLEDPNKVIPQLLAEAHTNAYEAVMRQLQETLPSMMEQVETQRQQRQSAEEQFFSRWPKLKNHRDRVAQLAKAYRQANPKATTEQLIQDVGAQAHIALGIHPSEESEGQGKKDAEPSGPKGGYAPAPGAAASTGAETRPANEPRNEFEALHEEWMEEMNDS